MDSCLFCTAPSTSDENVKEAPLQLKEEAFITDEADYHALRDSFSDPEGGGGEIGAESTKIHNHLKASFILSRILKLPQHSVSQILEHHHKNIADLHSPEENQVSLHVCASCGVLVAHFYHILEQVSELERKLAGIEVELKSKISSSINQVLAQTSSVNHMIRSLVLNGCSQDSTQEATYLHFNHDHHQHHSQVEEEEIMSEGRIHEQVHFENDEKDETEETEFKLNLAYMEQNETSPQSNEKSAETQNLSKQVPVISVRRRTAGASWRNYLCDHCPYRGNNKQQFHEHAKAHEEGSKASPCVTCGWFVFPENMVHHYHIRHRRNKEEVKKEVKKKPKRITKYRQCPQCQALVCGKLGEYRDHETMHLVGSGFECNLCGWLCKSLPHHNSKWHSKLKKVQMPEHNQIIIMP